MKIKHSNKSLIIDDVSLFRYFHVCTEEYSQGARQPYEFFEILNLFFTLLPKKYFALQNEMEITMIVDVEHCDYDIIYQIMDRSF